MKFTLQQVIGQNQYLQERKLAIQTILNTLAPPSQPVVALDPEMELSFVDASVLWIFSAIGPRGTITQDGMMVVIQLFKTQLRDCAIRWASQLKVVSENRPNRDFDLTPLILALSERKLVKISGASFCYDLQKCQQRESSELPDTFEGISYNLAVPVKLGWLRMRQEIQNGIKPPSQRNNPGNTNAGFGTAHIGG